MARAHIGNIGAKPFFYELNTLTRHAAVLGTTGSGKTVMCKVLIENCMARGIPIIAIDPKGDIGSLAVTDKHFDFRPYGGMDARRAIALAQKTARTIKAQGVDTSIMGALARTATTIYTPKSRIGTAVNLLPNLTAPDSFAAKTTQDPGIIADFVEPVSGSILQLAGIKGGSREKAQTLIAQILTHHWNEGNDLGVAQLIAQINDPPFQTIGPLAVDDFLKETERLKIAAQINLILTSPSKTAWSQGKALNMRAMLTAGTLSVFDLRHCAGTEEKQFAVEHVMQELYKHLLHLGGTEKLRYVLYIDELAGLLPPPPSSPPSKKLLELLIRQGRAMGLGIIVATQNPGDIDYKVLGNIGTRFIGKLRTENDIIKVATATDLAPARLKAMVAELRGGDFICNNSVSNSTKAIHARWLLTYHGGPLSAKEIGWINDHSTLAQRTPITIPKTETVSRVKPKGYVSTKTILRWHAPTAKKKRGAPSRTVTDTTLGKLIRQVKRHADDSTMKISLVRAERYVPHLRIVIEARPIKGLDLDLQGPYVFDLTSKAIPIGNYLSTLVWRQYTESDLAISPIRRSVNSAFDYAVREARRGLRRTYHESTIQQARSEDRAEV
ncbi:MAG: helicase HerA-like domain-containing protein, partial [Nanoarchaeota archaeon]